MKVSDINVFVAKVKAGISSPELLDQIKELEGLLCDLNNDDEVNTQLRTPLMNMLNVFWDRVIKELPYEKWQGGEEVELWLELQCRLSKIPDSEARKAAEVLQNKLLEDDLFLDKLHSHLEMSENAYVEVKQIVEAKKKLAAKGQKTGLNAQTELELVAAQLEKKLAEQTALQKRIAEVERGKKQKTLEFNKLIRANFLDANYHHSLLFDALRVRYEHLGSGQLSARQLLFLLERCGRLVGYAEKEKLEGYPITSLPETPLPQETQKFKEIVVLLGSIFYLIFHYCTAEQLSLLPHLIYFRLNTTDEERRSEQAILSYLSTRIFESQEFFKNREEFFDANALEKLQCLQAVKEILPKSRIELIRSVNKNRWLYAFIHQTRVQNTHSLMQPENISAALKLLENDFAASKDRSYKGALNFAEGANTHVSSLTEEGNKTVSLATYLFCLDKYVQEHQNNMLNAQTLGNSSGGGRQIEQPSIVDFRQQFQWDSSLGSPWIYVLRHRRNMSFYQLLHYVDQLFNIQFGAQEDKSCLAALAFSEEIKKQYTELEEGEVKIVHAALHSFCLKQYIHDRRSDKQEKHSTFSFSSDTKCNAALKKRWSILGYPQGIGFFERMALNQGRLKTLETAFENNEEARQSRF